MTGYSYRLKRLLRNKTLFFWSILFPIALATLFKMAFGDITKKEWAFETIAIAVVNEGEGADDMLMETLETLENDGKKYFSVTKMDFNTAEQKLKDKEIKAIIKNGEAVTLVFLENGLAETVTKTIVDSYLQSREMLTDAAMSGHFAEAMEAFSKELTVVSKREFDGASKDPMISFFQALLAMASLYGAMYGLVNTQEMMPEYGEIASRRLSAPMKKLPSVVTDVAAAFTIQFLQFLLIMAYYLFFLKLDFGEIGGMLLFVGALHSLTGVSYGYFIGCLVRKSDNMQMAVMLGTVMLSCFLSGLMTQNMRMNLELSCPIINRINPATLMADSYQALCVMKNQEKFVQCMVSLAIWCVLLIGGSIFILALRQKMEKRGMERA